MHLNLNRIQQQNDLEEYQFYERLKNHHKHKYIDPKCLQCQLDLFLTKRLPNVYESSENSQSRNKSSLINNNYTNDEYRNRRCENLWANNKERRISLEKALAICKILDPTNVEAKRKVMAILRQKIREYSKIYPHSIRKGKVEFDTVLKSTLYKEFVDQIKYKGLPFFRDIEECSGLTFFPEYLPESKLNSGVPLKNFENWILEQLN